jgi:hypothetical protein
VKALPLLKLAIGWNERRLINRIWDICRFAALNGEAGITLKRRRRIARLANDVRGVSGTREGEFMTALRELADAGRWGSRELLKEIDGLAGLSGGYSDSLNALSDERNQPKWRMDMKRGGNRRSGERQLRGHVLRMAVLLYCEAHEKPGFTEGGPLVRFANAVAELALGETRPFKSAVVRDEYRLMRPKARRTPSLQVLYNRN